MGTLPGTKSVEKFGRSTLYTVPYVTVTVRKLQTVLVAGYRPDNTANFQRLMPFQLQSNNL